MDKPVRRIRVGDRVTIYQRGAKKIYVADFWRDGRHQRLSLHTSNRTLAMQRAIKLNAELEAGTFRAPPPPTTVRQAISDYFDYLRTEGRARKTIVRYEGELTRFRDFLQSLQATRLSQITPALFDKFRAHCKTLGHAPRTMHHEAVVVKQWLKWCHRRHLVAANLLADYQLKKPITEPLGGPSLEEVNAILASSRGYRGIALAVLAFTGMRVGECQRLQLDDVDLHGGWITIASRDGAETKSRRSRKVPIADLRSWRVFCRNPCQGRPGGGSSPPARVIATREVAIVDLAETP